MGFELIAFDADDTLWHNEPLFLDAKGRFKQLLAAYHAPEWIEARLDDTEIRNLRHFGYGIKSFALSMIETAIELTEGRITGREIQQVLDLAKEMVNAPLRLLAGAEDTVRSLAQRHRLILITKGDLFDQESKIARSGLGDLFHDVEVVTEKRRATYEAIVDKHGVAPQAFLMVGDSLRSDILPVVEMGGHAIHVPYDTTWRHEEVPQDVVAQYDFAQADGIRDVARIVAQLDRREK
jgi:putative hydrolase of the HAD superfamily